MNERTIFLEALEQPTPERREAFLTNACGEDTQLRQKVEQLLRAHADSGSFIEHSPAGESTSRIVGQMPGDTDDPTALFGAAESHASQEEINLPFLSPSSHPKHLGRLGAYEILEVIGRGAFGIVLRALDPKLNRVVAIKVLAPELASNAMSVRRFLKEAQAAAAVSHDHVVTIHAVDDTNALPFLVMECVLGESLAQKIDKQGALPVAEVLRIGMQIAAGLAAAHKQGLVHRDIKPGNILLENGVQRVKITDFGLARSLDDLAATQTFQVAGTPQYMSPEQAHGAGIDQRSDLFSLGSVIYAMCTGRAPFRAHSIMGILKRVCDDTPRPIREVNPEIPEWLETIVRKLHEKNPFDRYQTAAEVTELLGRHLVEVQQPSQAAGRIAAINSPSELASPSKKTSRWQLAAFLSVLLGVLCLSLVVKFGDFGVRRRTDHGLPPAKRPDTSNPVEISATQTAANPEPTNAQPHRDVAKPSVDIDFDAERGAAQWALSVGGRLVLERPDGSSVSVMEEKLPPEPFAVVQMIIVGNKALTIRDDDLIHLSGCRRLQRLSLAFTSLNGSGLAHLQTIPTLTQLFFTGPSNQTPTATDESLAPISKLSHLRMLSLANQAALTEASLAHLATLTDLEFLTLSHQSATDKSLEQLRPLHRLRTLQLIGLDGVTDDGVRRVIADHPPLKMLSINNFGPRQHRSLAGIADAKQLESLGVCGDQLTELTGPILQQLPLLYRVDISQPTDEALANLSQAAQIRTIALTWDDASEAGFSQAAYRTIAEFPDVNDLLFNGLTAAGSPTDASLVELAKNPKLKFLNVTFGEPRRYTAVGIAEFRALRPDVSFFVDGQQYLPKAPVVDRKNSDDSRSWIDLLANPQLREAAVQSPDMEPQADGFMIAGDALNKIVELAAEEFAFRNARMRLKLQRLNFVGTKHDITFGFRFDTGISPALQASFLHDDSFDVDSMSLWRKRPDGSTVLLSGSSRKVDWKEPQEFDLEFKRGRLQLHWNGETIQSLPPTDGIGKATPFLMSYQSSWKVLEWKIQEIPPSTGGWHGWPPDAPPPAIAPFDATQAKKHQEAWAAYLKAPVEYQNSLGMKFRLIPPGEFLMGSTPDEIEATLKRRGDEESTRDLIRSEGPQHKVTLTKPFYLGIHEVTQQNYTTVNSLRPSGFSETGMYKQKVEGKDTSDFPVENVSWTQAVKYCLQLSELEKLSPAYQQPNELTVVLLKGTGYRLPAEAEWEFACRAGTTTRFWRGETDDALTQAAWFIGSAGMQMHAVGQLSGNPFGLYDMHGSVSEWTLDVYDATAYAPFADKAAVDPAVLTFSQPSRVHRGGSWFQNPHLCRSAFRGAQPFAHRSEYVGLRMVLSVEAVKQALEENKKTSLGWHGWPIAAPPPAIAPFDADKAQQHQESWANYLGVPVEYTNMLGMKFRLIPPGEFLMGSTPEEAQRALPLVGDDQDRRDIIQSESPQHQVILTQPFFLGVHEITQAQYTKIKGKHPPGNSTNERVKRTETPIEPATLPIDAVSWVDAGIFCSLLSKREGLKPLYQTGMAIRHSIRTVGRKPADVGRSNRPHPVDVTSIRPKRVNSVRTL